MKLCSKLCVCVFFFFFFFFFGDTRFFALYWTPSFGILLNPKAYKYISYGHHEFVKFITKTIIFLVSYLIFSFFFFNELLGQFKNLEYLGNRPGSSLIKSNLLWMIKSSQATIARRKGTNVCARLLVPMSILSKEKEKLFLTSKASFPIFFGFDLVNDSIEQCWKIDPISACQAPFSFYFLLIQIQFLRLVGTNISNSIYPFQFQFYVML